MATTRPMVDRLLEKIDFPIDTDCWIWNAALDIGGYGKFMVSSRDRTTVLQQAHRVVYEYSVGPIPSGLQLDHLCRNRACVNPDHLEPVTQRENILRGEGIPGKFARRTHCKNGHEYTDENTYRLSTTPTHRGCRECSRARMRTYHEAKKLRASSEGETL